MVKTSSQNQNNIGHAYISLLKTKNKLQAIIPEQIKLISIWFI